jgi:homeobox protein cut-like
MMKQSLEVQLMEKNKSLENNYTQLKVRFSQLEETSSQDQITLASLQQKVKEQQDLVQRLEEDLLYRVGNPTSTTAATTTTTNDHRPSTDLPRSSTSSSLTGLGLDLSHHQQTSLSPSNSSFDLPQQQQQQQQQEIPKEDKTILPIVIQQRDRFRQRNAELEQKSRGLERQLDDVRADMERLQQDNLNLYERLKFVHVWKEEQQQRGATVSSVPL